MKPPVIESIEKILGKNVTLHPAPARDGDPLGGLMAYKKDQAKYLLDGDQLIGLNLAKTGLTDTQWQEIQQVKGFAPGHIQALNLSENQLTNIHFGTAFRALARLDLSDNRLEQLTFQGDCPRLERLQIEGNQLKELLLPEGAGFDRLQEVRIAKNPLSSTFESAAKEGPAAFARFIRRLAMQGVAESYEIKLLIVGEGETGKTTLWKLLLDPTHLPDPNQKSTIGIGIHEGWSFDHPDQPGTRFFVNLWDFGGQEIQYMTHQFFLTRRSCYVLLADGRREVANFSYWFKIINLLGVDENNPEKLPVLVVLNEKGNPIAKMPYDPATVATDFPRLQVEKYEVDFGKEDVRRKGLATYIQDILSRRFPHLPLKVPGRWGEVRGELQRLRNEEREDERKNYLTAAEFAAICAANGIEDAEQRRDLSRLLHDLGIILHYHDVRVLHDFIILNPEWAVHAVYELMRHPRVKDENQGRFDIALLNRVWSDCGYTENEKDGLLNLMLKDGFEVCFQAKEHGKTIYIAPQLLPEFQPEGLDWPEEKVVLRFIYQYAFMPKGIIGRLIVRLHEHLETRHEQKVIWEKGMILAKNGCRALVLEIREGAETGLNQIRIEVMGQQREDCKYVLRDITEQLDFIHRDSFPALAIVKKIPCICSVCRDSVTPHFYDLSELENRRADGKKTIECRFRPYESVVIENLLEGVLPGERALREKPAVKKVFFSYSRKDRELLEELLEQLSGLRRSGVVEPWHDHLIKPGEEWDDAIKRNLSEADIIILLVSPSFLATDYIWEVEIKAAMQRHEQGDALVIPVFVRPCDWAGMPFGKLNGLPSKAKPVTEYDNRDAVWLAVVEGIKRAIG